ncbi:MAG TPA: NADH-specific enoyl-ACP reductase [Rhodospirillaceae bacterium]|nr:enoyl-[acyl-carrier-protein] reductase FabI [Alphaproteobacteria bacterium]MAS47486.1 enoyl-[acyl-carrier-protein] reductase FabI [Alphaproteobacteria bacterium]MBN52207.1 enoyl-[acyl-carrier-protein] reductase FabI [Alphaproteobacteria bacterium]OUT41019.1 MAG: enoyl-ACP reductase [Micavibrio sp. TMED2]HCI48214.1 NADH-specific enoyl-ACP reductase [Rhodospirillaceae bacterium]|tara:strand:- start:5076 stop:5894 length:819 start_codon:yes stop_codon:yes gene_type:complete
MTDQNNNPASKPLLAGKRGLVMGVANDRSIAWGIAKALHGAGAELAFTYQGDAFKRRVEPLASELDAKVLLPCDVMDESSVDKVFDDLKQEVGNIDFVIHAVAFSNKEELKGRYVDTTLDNFLMTMQISCYSFTSVARRAAEMMNPGGSLLTLSYIGAERVMPNYNVMGVAKAALEASVRYLANDLGPDGIRVHGLSAGPMKTLAGSAIANARYVYRTSEHTAPLRRSVTLEDIGGTATYLLSDLSAGVTGQIHYVDAGFHGMGMLPPGAAE